MHDISLKGARTHNLRSIDLQLRPGEMVALTGPSGAGKSSLALDTLYAEGQRRFVESFSPYARQFLERLERPPVDSLEPVAATVCVDRRAPVKSSRSTLATMADLEPYLSALFAKEALPVCPDCGVQALQTSANEAATRLGTEGRAIIGFTARVVDTEGYLALRETLLKQGFTRIALDGEAKLLDEVKPSEASEASVMVVVDRVALKEKRRVQEAIESAWEHGGGKAIAWVDGQQVAIARGLRCPTCARAFEPPHARLFSYNSPLGACDACRGFGRVIGIDWGKVIPDETKSLDEGVIKAWGGKSAEWERGALTRFAKRKKIPTDVAWNKLTQAQRDLVLNGEGEWKNDQFPGVRAWFKWLETRTYKMHVRVFLARYREYTLCETCKGARLNATALSYRVADKNLGQWHAQTVDQALTRVSALVTRDAQGKLVQQALADRLGYLSRVGLGYLALDRQGRTLSGGEAQRAGLTTALGAALTGTLFVLDEPTVGLHATDVPKLATVMRELAQANNTVLVIEHDASVVKSADRVLEMGPAAGKEGGRILFDGTPQALAKRIDLPTGKAWHKEHAHSPKRRQPSGALIVKGATENNLRGIDVSIPIGVLTCVTGPSGSGKSTLVEDIVYRSVAKERAGAHTGMLGAEVFKHAVLVDQSPLGRTARGNAATYTKAWDRFRTRFAAEPTASARALEAKHFSFNVEGGRCQTCAGEGYETVEMQFLADVSILCPVCQGKRFKPEVLGITTEGVNVAEALDMTVSEALARFKTDQAIVRALTPVQDVGLGYLPLGQPLSTLSGGEAQRLKLARALSEPANGTLYCVDEPSAGLHAQDVEHVLTALHRLVDQGATVVVVEHDLSVIRACDWVIDMGPDAGPDGGQVVAEGTPEQVTQADTRTGAALRMRSVATDKTRRTAERVDHITVKNAREHNLKNVSVAIPHGKLAVVTGPSGSGKSSLAFDVVFAEGQRRFMETLTPYARQFLPTLPRPDVDHVGGVPPAIALEQRITRGGANSTVATVTEIAHYLRLLYAKVGERHCPKCDTTVSQSSAATVFAEIAAKKGAGTVYAPAVRARKGTYLDLFNEATRAGVKMARVDGKLIMIEPPPKLAKSKEHTIDLVVYTGPLRAMTRDTFDRAIQWGAGAVRMHDGPPSASEQTGERVLSMTSACPKCGTGVPELDPRWFSFNTKQGQCHACAGTGIEGAAQAIEDNSFDGSGDTCSECDGQRLAPVPRRVRLQGLTYPALVGQSVSRALKLTQAWKFSGDMATIADAPHKELVRRLRFVEEVGLGYLGLDRSAKTLSGGEMQRLRLSAQLGSGLTGALYVLDEPTIGLHPRDTGLLINNLRALVDTGSTVLVVEHDAETIEAADFLIDLGPTGGRGGGAIVAAGEASSVLANPLSPTGQALRATPPTRKPRPPTDAEITLEGARAHNLQGDTLRVPVGRMTVVCGVSGSGKSTLVRQVFYPAVRKALKLVADPPLGTYKLSGANQIKRAMAVDQSPIGRTPRSVPATFLGIFDDIRKLYASMPDAKTRGFTPQRFSFNTAAGGRCPTCEGQGAIVSEMSFLPDVVTPCESCGGMRFEPSTLDIRFSGFSLGEVLQMSADDAAKVFANHPRIARPLRTLSDLGVGYLQLGQGSNTLSGGEAQRLKLAAELTAGSMHEPTLYVLDEPTTGLHLSDVTRLVSVMHRLVERGDTLVIIEHQPNVIAASDWVIELGPEAGENGGRVVFQGPPGKLPKAKTATGRYFAAQGSRH